MGTTNLRKNVVHRVGGLLVAGPEHAQQPQDLDLQKRIGDASHIVLRRVARHNQVLEDTHERRNQLRVLRLVAREGGLHCMSSVYAPENRAHPSKMTEVVWAEVANLINESDAGDQNAMVALAQLSSKTHSTDTCNAPARALQEQSCPSGLGLCE